MSTPQAETTWNAEVMRIISTLDSIGYSVKSIDSEPLIRGRVGRITEITLVIVDKEVTP